MLPNQIKSGGFLGSVWSNPKPGRNPSLVPVIGHRDALDCLADLGSDTHLAVKGMLSVAVLHVHVAIQDGCSRMRMSCTETMVATTPRFPNGSLSVVAMEVVPTSEELS